MVHVHPISPGLLPIISALLLFISATLASSPCPPRQFIYPCSCVNAWKKGGFFTAVSCHRLHDSDALRNILPFLRSMHIDQFSIYDSFWEASESQRVLPTDWLTLTKIKALEITDTPLTDRFMCSWSVPCKNTVLTRFVAINSSQSSNFALCPTKDGRVYPWTGCSEKLEHFQLSHGKLASFKNTNIFQTTMNNVTTVNLTRNQIMVINQQVFQNLPQLSKLDLSHNFIEHLDGVFDGSLQTKLIFLDVSWNNIKTLGEKLLPSLPLLNTFRAESNKIVDLNERDWIRIPKSLKHIKLENNPVHCSCAIRWINGTSFQKLVKNVLCATPDKFKSMNFKAIVQVMVKKCDKDGKENIKKIF